MTLVFRRAINEENNNNYNRVNCKLNICFNYIFYLQFPNTEPSFITQKIKLKNPSQQLYFKSKTWGLTADHTVTILSENGVENWEADSLSDYIYPGEDFLFYRISKDSLWLYVYSKAKIPRNFKSKINIVQVELENRDMITLKKTHLYMHKRVDEFIP